MINNMLWRNASSLVMVVLLTLAIGCQSTPEKKEDAGHGHDYRTFHTSGKIDYGEIGDSYTSNLVMYLAGNQFMVMEELIKDFQKKHPDIKTVYVETIPPGQILKGQIL
jgi:ABC-type glycerol-3-phosphate transport system substrate-binding protein